MKKMDVYKCPVCGLTFEVLHECECAEAPICCGKPMQLMPEQTAEFKTEKHVPYPFMLQNGLLRVTVGRDMPHPMTKEHFIEWIEVLDGSVVSRWNLKPGDEPAAQFTLKLRKGMIVRAFCNLHGLWSYKAPENIRRNDMDKYICEVCGYQYDPEKGDPANGVAPGTKWEDVPADWVCPDCGVGKDSFKKD